MTLIPAVSAGCSREKGLEYNWVSFNSYPQSFLSVLLSRFAEVTLAGLAWKRTLLLCNFSLNCLNKNTCFR